MSRRTSAGDLVFVGFNGRVIALDRATGAVAWRWDSGVAMGGFVAIVPDADRLFVSCRGYTWALDPATGRPLWHQPLKGEGTGIPCLATMRAVSDQAAASAYALEEERAAANAESS